MSTFSLTTNSKLNDKEKKRRKIFKIPKFLKSIGKRGSASNPPEALNSTTTEISNPPETIESLRKYENKSGQAQKFLDRVGQDFRWPASMNEVDRGTAFFYLTDESALEFDDETGFNLIFFYNNIDKGTFDEHKNDWVLVYKQEVKKYGTSEYTSKELVDLEDEMPGAIYLPVDDNIAKSPPARTVSAHRANQEHMVRLMVRRLGTTKTVTPELNFNDPAESGKLYKTVIDSGAQETTLPYHVRSVLGKTGWQVKRVQANGYGYPSCVFYASTTFEIAVGDDNGWSKWVNTNTLRVWQTKPGGHVDSSLVGTDALDQFYFIHDPNQGYKFLRETDEVALTNFMARLP
ncbi:536_t:CDS:2 [Funneliformis geosporum]|uniref:4068_t:CDS:1 n=1 Tax=Funneliformis geosporum TaxID=1117311 RepID=A0A9W4T1Z6_9GLOM|nr:536_t:CDS:2 [Funneliformis geosporum]CAI2189995.1 4068_t:CDS:2 [Funneliformis geosporum]